MTVAVTIIFPLQLLHFISPGYHRLRAADVVASVNYNPLFPSIDCFDKEVRTQLASNISYGGVVANGEPVTLFDTVMAGSSRSFAPTTVRSDTAASEAQSAPKRGPFDFGVDAKDDLENEASKESSGTVGDVSEGENLPCEYGCGKSFSKSYLRNKHHKVHNPPYACSCCDKRFSVLRDK
jgi:hypothetical protein